MAYSLTGPSSPHDVHDGHTSLSASASQTNVTRGIRNSLQWHITVFNRILGNCRADQCQQRNMQLFTMAHNSIQMQTGL